MQEEKRLIGTSQIGVLRIDNIVEVLDNKEWDQPDTLEVAKEDVAMLRQLIDGRPDICLLIEIPNRHTSKEILNYYQQMDMGEVARAMIIDSFAAKLIGNLYLKVSKGKPNEAGRVVPTKLFRKKDEAEKWLLDRMEKHKK